jgi:sugar phosphate permease
MFLIFGLLTIAVGILIFLFFPDNPMTSRLSHEEKIMPIERIRENMTGIENKSFKIAQMFETLLDPHVWLICLITIGFNVPNGAVGTFQAAIIKR